MPNIVGLIVLVAIAAFMVWIGTRALKVQSRAMRWSGVGLAAVLTIAVSSVSALIATGLVKQNGRAAPVPSLKVELTSERIARGKAVADSFCSGCHATALTGGGNLAKDLPIDIGSFVAANLTPAGVLKQWADGEIFRAIRNGIDANGSWLVIMSFTNASRLSDDDTAAVIAYLRSLPAAGVPTPGQLDRFNLLGLAMLGAGLLPEAKPVTATRIAAPSKGRTAQYGEYLLSYQDCRECHGKDLGGGVPGQLPPLGPDLGVVRQWTLGEFVTTMRSGVDPNGHQLDEQTPWRPIGRMDDDELAATYQYLVRPQRP